MSFASDLNNFTVKLENGSHKTVKEITFQALKMIIEETPVDTGRAKSNWYINPNIPSKEVDWDKKTPNITEEMSKVNGKEKVIYITNNLPYIMRLEHGWSRKRPAGMVAISLERLKAYINSGVLKL